MNSPNIQDDDNFRGYMAYPNIQSGYSGNSHLYHSNLVQTKTEPETIDFPFKLPASVPSSLVIQPVQMPISKPETFQQQYAQIYPNIQPESEFNPMSNSFRSGKNEEAPESCIQVQPLNYFFPAPSQCLNIAQIPLQFHSASLPPPSEPFIVYNFENPLENANIVYNSIQVKTSKMKRLQKAELKKSKIDIKIKKKDKIPKQFYKKAVENEIQNEGPSIEKRCNHNDMERQRRIAMRNLYVELKQAVPTISETDRVPKVNILRAAHLYCRQIQKEEKLLIKLRQRNKRLTAKLTKLGALKNKPLSVASMTSSASSFDSSE